MNERIRELLKQSAQTTNHYGFDQTFVDHEKFAQLIVRECMNQIDEVRQLKSSPTSRPNYNIGFDDGMFVAIRTIEEHFGVEE